MIIESLETLIQKLTHSDTSNHGKIIKQTATSSIKLIFLGKKMAKLLISCYSHTDQRIPLDTHKTTCQYFGNFPLVLSQYSETNLENGR